MKPFKATGPLRQITSREFVGGVAVEMLICGHVHIPLVYKSNVGARRGNCKPAPNLRPKSRYCRTCPSPLASEERTYWRRKAAVKRAEREKTHDRIEDSD